MQENKVLWVIITTVLVVIFAYSLFFNRPTYLVTFNSNGGPAVNEQEVDRNNTASKPSDPVREGYTFDGWMYDGKEYDFSTEVTDDITLEASWSVIKYTITFDTGSSGSDVESITVAHGEVATKPENPTRNNRKFDYWRYAGEDGERFNWDTEITEDIELVAVWKR